MKNISFRKPATREKKGEKKENEIFENVGEKILGISFLCNKIFCSKLF